MKQNKREKQENIVENRLLRTSYTGIGVNDDYEQKNKRKRKKQQKEERQILLRT